MLTPEENCILTKRTVFSFTAGFNVVHSVIVTRGMYMSYLHYIVNITEFHNPISYFFNCNRLFENVYEEYVLGLS